MEESFTPDELPPQLLAAHSIADLEALVKDPIPEEDEFFQSLDLESPLTPEERDLLGPDFVKRLMADVFSHRQIRSVPAARLFEHGLTIFDLIRQLEETASSEKSERERIIVDGLIEVWKLELAEALHT